MSNTLFFLEKQGQTVHQSKVIDKRGKRGKAKTHWDKQLYRQKDGQTRKKRNNASNMIQNDYLNDKDS